MITTHYLIKTEAEILALASLFASDPILPSIGKRLSDVFGKNKTYNTHYQYSVDDFEKWRITNPSHPSFGKVVVRCNILDIQAHAPDEEANLLTKEELGDWRLEE